MGKIYLFTGEGAGKTTNALGLAMRSIGHNHKVVMIQFMKWWKNTGEYKIQNKLKPYFKVYQFGRPVWLKLDGGKAKFGKKKFNVKEVQKLDREYALKGLFKAEEIMLKDKPDLLILDEICLAVHSKLLRGSEVLAILDEIPQKTTVVLTGRHASKSLIKKADFVNTMNVTKYPSNIPSEEGIQY
jgi:cob(I)alamin adenosyltransferase